MRTIGKLTAVTAIIAAGGFMWAPPSMSAPSEHLNWGQQLNVGADACASGQKILNINYKINNSLDSGTGTNDFGAVWWAFIDYVLQVQVFEIDFDTFCARVKTQGSFESVRGDGPGCATDPDDNCGDMEGLEAGVVGTFQGGFTGTFDGTFNPSAGRTKGSIGTFDHNCNAAAAGGDCNGAGVTRWRSDYFTNVTNDDIFAWWGWVYHAGNNGSWVNSGDGNSGNITGD